MTRDQIIEMAIMAGLYSGNPRTPGTGHIIITRATRFAKLVAEATAKRQPLSQEQIFAAARVADHSRDGLWTVVFAREVEKMHGIGDDPHA